MLLTNMIMQATDAGAAAPGGMGGILQALLLPLGMIAIFYFLLIRPQNARAKKHKEMLGSLKKGDEVVTSGGIIGKIAKLSDREVTLDTGEGGKLRIQRGMIVDLYKAGEPAPANDVVKQG